MAHHYSRTQTEDTTAQKPMLAPEKAIATLIPEQRKVRICRRIEGG